MRSNRHIGIALPLAAAILVATGAFVSLGFSGKAASDTPSRPLVVAEAVTLEGEGLSSDQAQRELEVQHAVDRSGILPTLEEKMGHAFGGAWFEPAAGQLRVGFASLSGRRALEDAVAGAGLGENVAAIPVRFSWAELVATQVEWNRRLADLFADEEVETLIDPRANAVKIKVGSSVPSTRVAVLEQQASEAGIDILVVPVSRPKLRVDLQSRCAEWKEHKAYCDPTIAAGVSIEDLKSSEPVCTDGPAVIRKDLSKETTETFLLTAGHCIEKYGGVGREWYAFNKSGSVSEIGSAVAYLTAAHGDKADVGVIKIETAHWKNNTQTPVPPQIALWGAAEPEPFSVPGQIEPVVGHTTCISGEASSSHCGTIASVTATFPKGGEEESVLENMVEVNSLVPTIGGDSGAPWYSSGEGMTDYVEGTHVGITGIHPVFEPLSLSFKQLEEIGPEFDFELLDTGNETRPKCPMAGMKCFEAETYPATFTGSQSGTQTFGFESQSVQCSTATFSATLTEGLETLEVPPTYSSCLSGVTSVSIDTNECKYKFAMTSEVEEDKYKGTVDIACPTGKSIAVTSACGCTITVGSQTALGTVEYVATTSASPKKDFDMKLSITGLKYTESSGCKTPGTRSNGTYSGELTVKGDAEGGSAQGVWVSG
jgi:hypothetical protein